MSSKYLILSFIFFMFISLGCNAQGVIRRPTESNPKVTSHKKAKIPKVSNPDGFVNGHGYIDLGLSSGIRWATCDVGSDKPEMNGCLFAWGETSPKSDYNCDDYSLDNYFEYNRRRGRNEPVSEYYKQNCIKTFIDDGIIDKNGKLTYNYDAASKCFGTEWRMPSETDFDELFNSTTHMSGKYNGVMGVFLTSKINKKTIFLPAQYSFATKVNGEEALACLYWTSTMDLTCFSVPCIFYDTDWTQTRVRSEHPCHGLKIRPIL